jgi:hypothetical protein
MANPRLLIFVGAIAGVLGAGCYRLPETLEMPEVRGRVVDAETGQPIAGAEVFVWMYAESKAMLAISAAKLNAKFQTTNQHGEFAFPAERFVVPRQVRRHWRLLSPAPWVTAVHRDYGWAGIDTTRMEHFEGLTLRMKRDSYLLERLVPHETSLNDWCGGFSDAMYDIRSTVLRPYYRCCDVVFGVDAPVCRRPGPRREAVLRELEKEYE